MRERGEEKIAKVVAHETAPRMEAVLKEAAEKGFIFRKSDHAVADVAGRKDAVFAAQAAGAAAIIGDGDDSGEVGDGTLGRGMFIRTADHVLLEAAKERGKTGAAAESDDAKTTTEAFRIGLRLFHVRMPGNVHTSLYRKEFNSERAEEKRTDRLQFCQPAVPSFSG